MRLAGTVACESAMNVSRVPSVQMMPLRLSAGD